MASQLSWSDLQQELLELIFDSTKDTIDILRCGAVCKSWQSVALQVYRKFFRLCLIHTHEDPDHETGVVLNLLTKETRKIHLPEAKGRWICCSRNSWLLTMDNAFHMQNGMYLFNIFSRTQIILPKLGRACYIPIVSRLNYKWKLFLSKCPSSSDCNILLLHGFGKNGCRISCCKPGEARWTDWDVDYFWERTFDAAFYNGNIYFSIDTCTIISFLWNFQLHHEIKIVTLPVPEPFGRYYIGTYIVKSLDDHLLFVVNRTRAPDGKLFFVFELDDSKEEVTEVDDLGGNALFITPTANLLLARTGNREAFFKGNCIYYFTSHDNQGYCVYDLKTQDNEYVPCQSFAKNEREVQYL